MLLHDPDHYSTRVFLARELVLKSFHILLGSILLTLGYDVLTDYKCPEYNLTKNGTAQFPEVPLAELKLRKATSGKAEYDFLKSALYLEGITVMCAIIYVTASRHIPSFGKTNNWDIYLKYSINCFSLFIDVYAAAIPIISIFNQEIPKATISTLEFSYFLVSYVILISLIFDLLLSGAQEVKFRREHALQRQQVSIVEDPSDLPHIIITTN